jgi:hypothetical protein
MSQDVAPTRTREARRPVRYRERQLFTIPDVDLDPPGIGNKAQMERTFTPLHRK